MRRCTRPLKHRSRRRDVQQEWLLQTAVQVWKGFEAEFTTLWRSPARGGDAHPVVLYPRAELPQVSFGAAST